MNIVELTGDDLITLSCPQYCCYFILHLSIALQSYLLSCLVLSPFTLPNALHSRFASISKIWLSFRKFSCYYDTLGLWFSLSSLPLFISSDLIPSLLFSQSSFTFFLYDVTAIYFCCLFLYFERMFAMGSPPSSSSLVFCWSELAAAELFLYGDLAT